MMIKRFLLGAKRRKALRAMRAMVVPIVRSMQKPGHSIPLDVLLDPLVLGYIRAYASIAIHQEIGGSTEEEAEIFADTIELLFSELAENNTAAKQMGRSLVAYSQSSNLDFRHGEDIATKHWVVSCGSKAFDDAADVARAFQFASATVQANTATFGANDDTPQQAAARFLHAQLLHHVSERYGVENPVWRQWVRGW